MAEKDFADLRLKLKQIVSALGKIDTAPLSLSAEALKREVAGLVETLDSLDEKRTLLEDELFEHDSDEEELRLEEIDLLIEQARTLSEELESELEDIQSDIQDLLADIEDTEADLEDLIQSQDEYVTEEEVEEFETDLDELLSRFDELASQLDAVKYDIRKPRKGLKNLIERIKKLIV